MCLRGPDIFAYFSLLINQKSTENVFLMYQDSE